MRSWLLFVVILLFSCTTFAFADDSPNDVEESEITPIEKLEEIAAAHLSTVMALMESSTTEDFVTSSFLVGLETLAELQDLSEDFASTYGQDSEESNRMVESIKPVWDAMTQTKSIAMQYMTLEDKRNAAKQAGKVEARMKPTLKKLLSGNALVKAIEEFNLPENKEAQNPE